jgi:hypothetical protein
MMSVATTSYAAHPYASAPAPNAHARRASHASRRSSMPPPPRDPLPPVPPMPAYHAAPPTYPTTYGADYGYGASTGGAQAPAPLPAYSRRDKPGADTRAAKASRTAEWVTTAAAPAPAPAGSLAAFGYAIDIGGAPPGYDDERRGKRQEEEGVIGMVAKRQLASDSKVSIVPMRLL